MLHQVCAGIGLAVLPATGRTQPTAEAPRQPLPPNSPVYRFRIGKIEAAVLLAGFLDYKPAPPPEAPAEAFRQALNAECLPGKLRLHYNVLLLRLGRHTVLIDAGPGGAQSATFGLNANLARLGVVPADITHVILTHAHFDHAGGLLDTDNRPVFPHAEHFCHPEEIAFWTAKQPDLSRLRMKPAGLLAAARRTFDHVPFTRLGAETRLPEGLAVVHSPGHTPGHLTLQIESRGESLHHISDLIHHYAVMLPHPDWSAASDVDPALAATTRRSVLARLAAERRRVFGFHLPFPGLGRLADHGEGYRWVPESWDAAE